MAHLARLLVPLALVPRIGLGPPIGVRFRATERHFVSSAPAQVQKNHPERWFLMAHLARFELTTLAFGGQYSIQLSYKC